MPLGINQNLVKIYFKKLIKEKTYSLKKRIGLVFLLLIQQLLNEGLINSC